MGGGSSRGAPPRRPRRNVSSRPIFPPRTSSASASPRFAGTIAPSYTASTARARPASTSAIVVAAVAGIVAAPARRAPARRRRGARGGDMKDPHGRSAPAGPRSAPKRYSPTRPYRPLRAPETVEDRDARALYAAVSKRAHPTHEAIEAALAALEKMLHRAGNVDGEGDGCGVLIDIPR